MLLVLKNQVQVLSKNGVDVEKNYCMILDEIFAVLTNIKIMILEPFVLKGSANCNTGEIPNKWDLFHTGVRERAEAARNVAEKYNIPFITLQDKFDVAAKIAENSYWLSDGVHPTVMVYELIKREWIECLKAL